MGGGVGYVVGRGGGGAFCDAATQDAYQAENRALHTRHSRRVWGHASPGIFLKIMSLKWILMSFGGDTTSMCI